MRGMRVMISCKTHLSSYHVPIESLIPTERGTVLMRELALVREVRAVGGLPLAVSLAAAEARESGERGLLQRLVRQVLKTWNGCFVSRDN